MVLAQTEEIHFQSSVFPMVLLELTEGIEPCLGNTLCRLSCVSVN